MGKVQNVNDVAKLFFESRKDKVERRTELGGEPAVVYQSWLTAKQVNWLRRSEGAHPHSYSRGKELMNDNWDDTHYWLVEVNINSGAGKFIVTVYDTKLNPDMNEDAPESVVDVTDTKIDSDISDDDDDYYEYSPECSSCLRGLSHSAQWHWGSIQRNFEASQP